MQDRTIKNKIFHPLKKKSKKAQITVFILIGLIILLIFGFLFYLVNLKERSESEINIEKFTSEVLKPKILEQYTTLCLDEALEQGLILIGKQGGYINFSDDDYLLFNQNKINYAILPGPVSRQYNLPPIRSSFTKNIAGELKKYIEEETKKCTDFSALEQIPELSSYKISEGNPEAEVRFAENEVIVFLTYPINFTYPDANPIKKLVRFVSKEDVRFERIYRAVADLVEKDIYNATFNIIHDKENSNDFLRISQDAELNKIDVPSKASYLFVITDYGSNIDNNPYIFQFARRNRPPILEAPEELIFEEEDYQTPYSFSLDLVDPDEEEPSLSFSSTNPGWDSITYPTNSFTITESDIGSHTITITAEDLSGQKETKIVNVIVCASDNTNGTLCMEKCGASPNCSKRPIGLLPDCTFNEYLFDECDSSCQFVQSNTCGCNAHFLCINKTPYSLIQNNLGWCYGNNGCENLCTQPIADQNTNNIIGERDNCGCIEGLRCFPFPYNKSIKGYCNSDNECIIS